MAFPTALTLATDFWKVWLINGGDYFGTAYAQSKDGLHCTKPSLKAYAFISAGEIPGYDDYVGNKGAVNLAVLRKDGFISLDADHEEGTVLTKPFELGGKKLLVNFAGRKHSHLQAEILDASDKVLANSASLTGNHMSGKIEWTEGDPAALAGQQLKLRFSLVNGNFYSYCLE